MSADANETPLGSTLNRELVDLALSVHNAALWSYRFADDTITWVSDGMDALLDMTGAADRDVRARLRELIEPVTIAAGQSATWQDFDLQVPVTGPDEDTRWIGLRARRLGDADTAHLVGLASAASEPDQKQSLAELADRYRLLVELSPDSIAVHQDGIMKYINPAGVSMAAAETDAEIIDRPITDFIEAESILAMQERIRSLTKAGQVTAPAEAKVKRFDGSTIPVEVVSVRTTWEGRPALQVILRDLSAQRTAQATLRYQAALVQHVSNAVIATTRAGVVTSWNPAAEKVYGISAEHAVGWHVEKLIGASLDPETVLAQGGMIESLHRHADGSARYIRVSAAAMDDGYVLVCADDTSRRRAEQHYTTVVNTLAEGVVVVGKSGLIESANPAAHRVLGAEQGDIVGSALTTWPLFDESGNRIQPESYPSRHTRSTGFPEHSRVIRLQRPDGNSVWLESTTRVLDSDDDAPHAVVLSTTDITERRRQNEILRYQASHDELTQLLNRKGINDLLANLVWSEPQQLGIVFCDIDNFKRINDSLGHAAGDELLATLAQRLNRNLPDQCTVGRLSGDEFVVVCSDVEAVGGLEKLLHRVSELLRTLVSVREHPVRVTASTGAATIRRFMTGEDLLRYADAAMFRAKTTGPGSAVLADPALLTSTEGQLDLEEQLRLAIDNDELTLHFQPILDRDGSVVLAEALLRWPHPERGLVSPNVILQVAEQGGLLRELDRWVLRTALHKAASWPARDQVSPSVAVNLAGLTPDDPGFVSEVNAALAASGLGGDRLVLEMVETALIDLSKRADQAMATLAGQEVRFAIDDFGTGYSSLARLKDLPAHLLKLDRRFVANLESDHRDRAVARAVVDMGHAMGHQCIAEGIETSSQFRILDELGIDLHQGFLLARPMPADQFQAQLAGNPHVLCK